LDLFIQKKHLSQHTVFEDLDILVLCFPLENDLFHLDVSNQIFCIGLDEIKTILGHARDYNTEGDAPL
jgi:hypothetical protein